MKYIIFIIIIILQSIVIMAQTEIDSLEALIPKREGVKKVDLLHRISFKYWEKSPQKGVEYGQKALEIAISIDDKSGEAQSLNAIGVNYWAMGDFDKALYYYLKAIRIMEELDDQEGLSPAYNNIAMIYAANNRLDKALEYFIKAKNINIKLNNLRSLANNNDNIANLYIQLNNTEKALELFRLNLEVNKNLNDKKISNETNFYIGNCLIDLNHSEEAITYLLKSYKYFSEISNDRWLTYSATELGWAYTNIGNYSLALKYLTEAENRCLTMKSMEILIPIYDRICNYYIETNNLNKAIEYKDKYIQAKDSLFNDNNSKQIARMQAKYENEKIEQENILLKKDNEVKTIVRNSFMGLSILIIILVLILFNRFRIKRKANAILSEKNILIGNQKEELLSKNKILRNQYDQVKLLNKTKDKFFSIIAHDLKSPFNAMQGFSELLLKNHTTFDVEKRETYIKFINDSSIKTYKLLENLLTWAQSQTGRIKFTPEIINISELITEIISLFKEPAGNKEIKLILNTEKDLSIKADKNMLDTVIRNLVSNSIKFTSKGGDITVKSQTITDENNQKFAEISVKDSGVGIPYEKQSKLFKITENVTTEGTEKETGTGLGLILCKEFIEQHSGKIWIESEVEKGCKFFFRIPLSN